MKEHFLTYEQSLAVKELGFDEPCFGYWKTRDWLVEEKTRTDGYTHADQECSAPLKSQFFKWVRDKYEYCIHITPHTENDGDDNFIIYQYEWEILHPKYFDGTYHDKYEEAEDACINKIIELIKNK